MNTTMFLFIRKCASMFSVRYQNLEESWKSLKFKILTKILNFQLIFLCGHQNAEAFFLLQIPLRSIRNEILLKTLKKIRVIIHNMPLTKEQYSTGSCQVMQYCPIQANLCNKLEVVAMSIQLRLVRSRFPIDMEAIEGRVCIRF